MGSAAKARHYGSCSRKDFCFRSIDLHEARVFRIASRNGMIFQFPETPRKGDMLFPRDVLISKEEDSVLKQKSLDFCEQ
jgi:hypothetical protein